MDDLRDYLLSFDPANDKTFSEGLRELAAISQHPALTLDEWWNNYELAFEEYIEDMGGTDMPTGERA